MDSTQHEDQGTPSIDVAHLARQREWSERTFGPGDRLHGVTDHIRKELKEVIEAAEQGDPTLPEWVDVVILALDGAWRSGATPEEIIAAVKSKQAENDVARLADRRPGASHRAHRPRARRRPDHARRGHERAAVDDAAGGGRAVEDAGAADAAGDGRRGDAGARRAVGRRAGREPVPPEPQRPAWSARGACVMAEGKPCGPCPWVSRDARDREAVGMPTLQAAVERGEWFCCHVNMGTCHGPVSAVWHAVACPIRSRWLRFRNGQPFWRADPVAAMLGVSGAGCRRCGRDMERARWRPRCPACGTSAATLHDPDGDDCRRLQAERRDKNADE